MLRLEQRVRLVALALLEGDPLALGVLTPEEATALAAVIRRQARKLRGDATQRVATFFEEQGAVDREVRVLAHRRGWRRATAAFALGDMGSPRPASSLVKALHDPDAAVRAAAARSLGRLGVRAAVEPVLAALGDRRLPRAVAGQALLAIGPAALPELRALQTVLDPVARALAVELVGLLGNASDDAALVERLRDSSAEVRANAARALGRHGGEVGASELRTALSDRIPFVRVAVATALGAVGDRAVVVDLLRVARDDEFDPAHAAAHAAVRLDPAAVRDAAREGGPHIAEAADLLEAHGR